MPSIASKSSPSSYVLSTVEMDWTVFFDYQKLVEEEIDEYCQIEVTENLREGGVHAHSSWNYYFHYLQRQWKTHFGKEVVTHALQFSQPNILSLGCGYGGIELSIARRLKAEQVGYSLTALDLNKLLFDQAIATAKNESLNINFEAVDLNFVGLPANSFDLIFAHASIHHVLNLEHLFCQVHQALTENGKLILLDIIGETQTLFWRENIEFAANLIRSMPEKYRGGLTDDQIPCYIAPALQVGMEGIRQEEIEEQVNRYFVPEKQFKYGSFMRLICTHPVIGTLIDPEVSEDRAYLESLCQLDNEQIESGKLRPTEMMAVFARKENVPIHQPGASLLAVLRSQFEKLKLKNQNTDLPPND